MKTRPNAIRVSEHFHLFEFEDRADNNLVVLHSRLVRQLELLRDALCTKLGREIHIVITSGTRTRRTNKALAKVLGWTHDGGSVAPASRHLPCYGGVAADLYALDKVGGQIVRTGLVKTLAQPFFAKVIAHYPTHIHVEVTNSDDTGD